MEAPGHVPSVPSPKSGTGRIVKMLLKCRNVQHVTPKACAPIEKDDRNSYICVQASLFTSSTMTAPYGCFSVPHFVYFNIPQHYCHHSCDLSAGSHPLRIAPSSSL